MSSEGDSSAVGNVLETRGLKKYFSQSSNILESLLHDKPQIQALDGVTISVPESTAVGIIGESGCGKTTLIENLMGLQQPDEGEILFRGEDLSGYSKSEWKEYRQNAQIIFQDPFNSLNPRMTVKENVMEPLKIHKINNKFERTVQALQDVKLDPPDQFLGQFPNHLSGGEKQRVAIARALVTDPDIIFADEPVSMLDISTQAAILNLLSELVQARDLSLVYISHDLSTVSYVCDLVHVMYLGIIVESAQPLELIENPKHPYTKELINAVPIPDSGTKRERTSLEGAAPDPINIGQGCRFRDRCPERMEVCEFTPETVDVNGDHTTACHLYYDHEEASK